jgi:hypothetical protein
MPEAIPVDSVSQSVPCAEPTNVSWRRLESPYVGGRIDLLCLFYAGSRPFWGPSVGQIFTRTYYSTPLAFRASNVDIVSGTPNPSIATTAESQQSPSESSRPRGCSGYILRITGEELLAFLSRWLARFGRLRCHEFEDQGSTEFNSEPAATPMPRHLDPPLHAISTVTCGEPESNWQHRHREHRPIGSNV